MLSIDECRKILNEASAPGVEYTPEEAERLRGILYEIARIDLHAQHATTPAPHDAHRDETPPPGLTLYKGINGRAG